MNSHSFPHISDLLTWMVTRECIRVNRAAGLSAPWTNDPILHEYRFCNVHREDDRVTQWIEKNWRTPHGDSPEIWHAMWVARVFNWPPTLQEIGYPEPWDKDDILYQLRSRMLTDQVFSSAYIVSTNGQKVDKLTYVMDMLDVGYEQKISTGLATLQEAYDNLTSINGIGSFMAGQIIADVKYTPLLMYAGDWWDWACPGPGSQRGLNRLCDLPLSTSWSIKKFIRVLRYLRYQLSECDEYEVVDPLCLQDLQNCLCEYDKWKRLQAGGRTRNRYKSRQLAYAL